MNSYYILYTGNTPYGVVAGCNIIKNLAEIRSSAFYNCKKADEHIREDVDFVELNIKTRQIAAVNILGGDFRSYPMFPFEKIDRYERYKNMVVGDYITTFTKSLTQINLTMSDQTRHKELYEDHYRFIRKLYKALECSLDSEELYKYLRPSILRDILLPINMLEEILPLRYF